VSKTLKIINQIFAVYFFVVTLSSNSWADGQQMSQKLWGGLKNYDVENLKNLSIAIDQNDHKKALEISKQMNLVTQRSAFADAAIKIALWNKYSQTNDNLPDSNIAFGDISRFVNDNQFFPNIFDLRKNAEKIAIVNNIPYRFSRQYFQNFPATNTESKTYLLKSKISYLNFLEANGQNLEQKNNLQKEIDGLMIDIWIHNNFSPEKEVKFLSNYGNKLTQESHIARINRLLWDNKNDDAKRIFYLVSVDYQKLFAAIEEIDKNPKYIDKILASIPRSLRRSDVLAYKIIIWRKLRVANNGADVKEVIDMLLDIPSSADNPDRWWSLRKLYSREMLKAKDYKKAYLLASKHGLKVNSVDFSDAEWTAGWIALRFLDKPKIAYDHFNNLYLNVTYPISLSRAAYWLGMSSQAMGDRQKAIDWYKIAIKYPTYFYGQLAIYKHRVLDSVGSQNDIILPKDPDILASDIKSMSKDDSLKIAYLLALMGDKKNSTKIFEYVVTNAKTDGEIAVVMRVVSEMDNKELSVKISKVAAKKNVFFIKDKFQIIKTIENDAYAPLVHAIIKQESGFAPSAFSSVGAIGFMQLMPATAEAVCKKIGLKYNRHKLANDVDYNVVLGSSYIKSLINDFDGSEILAIASYNAGPGASKRWINEFYDPRKTNDVDKVIDWIELITYSETRNYVQRIMENLIVYKYLMSRINYDEIK